MNEGFKGSEFVEVMGYPEIRMNHIISLTDKIPFYFSYCYKTALSLFASRLSCASIQKMPAVHD